MSIAEPALGRECVRLPGGCGEPAVPARVVRAAVPIEDVEQYRALLPQGFRHAADAYRRACADLTVRDLSEHYGAGQEWLRETFVPHVRRVVERLSGGAWDLSDYLAFAAGSDVDFIAHVIDASQERVAIYPGDWGGFLVGPSKSVEFSADARGALACICVPSVRNGQFTEDMARFCDEARHVLLNLNLYPSLPPEERREVAERLAPVLERSLLSVSFSRGFSLTASQLGLIFVHRSHPLLAERRKNWEWFSYFYNAVAARAFMEIDPDEVERVHAVRRREVAEWHARTGMPYQAAGSYYVKSFRVEGELPEAYAPLLLHAGLLRLCFKPQGE
jgi:hypothetical protein